MSDVQKLKSELVRERDTVIEICATMLAAEGMECFAMENGMKVIHWAKDKKRFTEEDVNGVKELIWHWMEQRIRDEE